MAEDTLLTAAREAAASARQRGDAGTADLIEGLLELIPDGVEAPDWTGYEGDPPEIGVRRILMQNGVIEAELETQSEVLAVLFAALCNFLGEAPNYNETVWYVKPKGRVDAEALTVTVQRKSGMSPHDARKVAEGRLTDLQTVVELHEGRHDHACCESDTVLWDKVAEVRTEMGLPDKPDRAGPVAMGRP